MFGTNFTSVTLGFLRDRKREAEGFRRDAKTTAIREYWAGQVSAYENVIRYLEAS